jgi:hypothetical protein
MTREERHINHPAHTITLLKQPSPVGYWMLSQGGPYPIQLIMYHRPRWLTRWAMRVVFDIHWRDA